MILKIKFFFLIIFFLNSCIQLPGIDQDPKKRKLGKKLTSEYSIEDVEINIISLNKATENNFALFNQRKVEVLDNEIVKFNDIYNYNYQYVLGTSDVVEIDLTDSDDVDGSYIIDTEGMIDLPFIGKIKIDNLTLDQAQNTLVSVVGKFYKNPDLQITISEYNSSKAFILGAVRNQITINLDQEPIKIIEAAIQADFNPSSNSKNFGSKGILRRDNKVYKIDLQNTFKSTDDKENFYLKKNDVIFIDKNSDAIHVFGELSRPGVYYPNLDYSLTELISTSGLNQLTANAKKVYVIRENYEKFLSVDVFQLNIKNPISLIAGKKFILHPKDIVFIPPAPIVKWNRTISLLLPQTDLFTSYNPIIQDGVKTGANANQTE
ncbi:MAG: hypothetical protein CMI79_00125 [Candidatus Pelagibacter sp.]|mgnify:FL=1|nr:hypothetical protein [Candidatus Pelagibacter sp.]|tara:strand:- start:1933 stop:3063 length:1131 start_codon:yes stop_codon:yes gene_type:complete